MLEVWRKLMDVLDARERRRLRLLLALMVLMGLSNMGGVAAIIPFLSVLADPEMVHTNRWLAAAYDGLGFETPKGFMMFLGGFVFVAFMGSILIRALTAWAIFRFGFMRNYSIGMRILRGYLGQPYAWFLGRHSADLAKTVLNEVSQLVSGLLLPLLTALSNGALVLSMAALMVIVNPLAALIMAVVIGLGYAAVFALVRRRLLRVGEARFSSNADRFRVAQETLASAKEIKVLGLEKGALQRFRDPSLIYAQSQITDRILGMIPRHLLEGIAFGGMIAVLLTLLALEDDNLAAVLPVAGVYALAGARMMPAMQLVYRGVTQIRFNLPTLAAVHAEVKAAEGQIPPPPVDPLRLHERLELRDVVYAYPDAGRTALTGISLSIRANATVGIVGGTGAGKTTAMDVMLGLLTPQSGALLVDGAAVEGENAQRAWRRSIGYVPQQIFLADDTIAANIAFGQDPGDIDHAAVERAARMAELHDFVTQELPEGYATRAGDRGVRLSGGQRQRIGIARALYHDPDVLILDEATSALDNVTERAVIDAVARLGGAKTVIMVAHRLSTVRNCDEIFLLEHGVVAASGPYDDLIERSETFREMAKGTA